MLKTEFGSGPPVQKVQLAYRLKVKFWACFKAKMAKKGLILGIILTAVGVVLSFVLFLWLAALGLQIEQQQQQGQLQMGSL
jgi:hypothetical protein